MEKAMIRAVDDAERSARTTMQSEARAMRRSRAFLRSDEEERRP
jgi:hypothetical protein